MHPANNNQQSLPPTSVPTRKTKLFFPELHTLWAFTKAIGATIVDINTGEFSACLECTEEQVALAVENYRASVLRVSPD